MKKKKGKKRLRRLFLLIFVLFIVLFFVGTLLGNLLSWINISNIFITGNTIYSDQEIIDMANLTLYPSSLNNSSKVISAKLKEDVYIKEVIVFKKSFTKVNINIVENKPLFYNMSDGVTVLMDGSTVDEIFNVPVLLNYVIDEYYDDFISELSLIDKDILIRIADITFVPNTVDDARFLLSMTDGNLVYINILTFDKINKYISIMEGLPKDNGVLYLDYGNNFEILD